MQSLQPTRLSIFGWIRFCLQRYGHMSVDIRWWDLDERAIRSSDPMKRPNGLADLSHYGK